MSWIRHLKSAIAHLNPTEAKHDSERPMRIGLRASTDLSYFHMESFLAPEKLSPGRRIEVERVLGRVEPDTGEGRSRRPVYDIEIHSEGAGSPSGSFLFSFARPEDTVREILDARPELSLALARNIAPFRRPAIGRIVHSVARENALFSLATALPDVIPFLSLPWVAGEFASDTAVLTANQIRMAFLLGAASDRAVGYREQKGEIASIIGGAFGWRSLARELAGRIPLGGGLIPKAAIAYAGTWVVGCSLERYYRLGYGLTRREREDAYRKAFERAKSIVAGLVTQFKSAAAAPRRKRRDSLSE